MGEYITRRLIIRLRERKKSHDLLITMRTAVPIPHARPVHTRLLLVDSTLRIFCTVPSMTIGKMAAHATVPIISPCWSELYLKIKKLFVLSNL